MQGTAQRKTQPATGRIVTYTFDQSCEKQKRVDSVEKKHVQSKEMSHSSREIDRDANVCDNALVALSGWINQLQNFNKATLDDVWNRLTSKQTHPNVACMAVMDKAKDSANFHFCDLCHPHHNLHYWVVLVYGLCRMT
jgi:hypothetical protein